MRKSLKVKTKGITYWKKKAWDQFSLYVRIRDALRTTGTVTSCVCCSCGRIKPAFGVGCIQAGHFIPGRKMAVLFSEIGVHGQCSYCNGVAMGGLKGNWPDYYEFMMKHYGQNVINHLLVTSKQVKKLLPFELEEMRDKYKRRYLQMLGSKELMFGESYEQKLCDYVVGSTYRKWLLLNGK